MIYNCYRKDFVTVLLRPTSNNAGDFESLPQKTHFWTHQFTKYASYKTFCENLFVPSWNERKQHFLFRDMSPIEFIAKYFNGVWSDSHFSIFSLRVFEDLRNEYFMLQIDILSQELRLQALQKWRSDF